MFKLLENKNTKCLENVEYVKSLLNKYPYFSVLYTILAKRLHRDNNISKKKALEIAAIYSPNRVVLKNIMTGLVDIDTKNKCTFEHLSFSKTSFTINKKIEPHKESLSKETSTSGVNLYVDDSIYPDAIISESLARIMEKQEKPQLAKKIYNRLIKKFPEKKSYFVHKINKLT